MTSAITTRNLEVRFGDTVALSGVDLDVPAGSSLAVIGPNGEEFKKGAAVVNDALQDAEYLVGGAFSVTDIIASFALNWGRRAGLTGGLDAVNAYLDRLYERPHCQLARPE